MFIFCIGDLRCGRFEGWSMFFWLLLFSFENGGGRRFMIVEILFKSLVKFRDRVIIIFYSLIFRSSDIFLNEYKN